MKKNKVLIIRFSSFGDILQGFTIPRIIKQNNSSMDVHWLTRQDFYDLLKSNSDVDRVIGFERKLGLLGLIKLALQLKNENYTHVYDAHNNVRSLIVRSILGLSFGNRPKILVRSKNRLKRFLLFSFHLNLFPRPFRGRVSFEEPLKKWGMIFEMHKTVAHFQFEDKHREKVDKLLLELNGKKWVTLVPSAAWEMKRWPIEHWQKFIDLMPEDFYFVFLGGPADTFIQELAEIAPVRTLNLAGQLTLTESSYLVTKSLWVISNDTGLLHQADLAGVHGLSLQGPTAFGFTTHPHLKTMEVNLACRPCTKDGSGKCSQKIYKKCMVEITPESIVQETRNHFT